VELGATAEIGTVSADDRTEALLAARDLLNDSEEWGRRLGSLVYRNTVEDVNSILARNEADEEV
jgi:hypothetical protein